MKKAFSIEQDVYQMITMAIELWRQGQYQTEETILVQALELAQRIDDLSSIIYIRRLLAYAQIDQWKYLEALDHCTWLISLASDPDYQDLLSWEDKFEIKNGYEAFITCAENLPNMVDEDILSVLNTAIGWLERIGKDEWTIMLRIKKGNIHLKRGETSQAEDAYTKSLALCLRADMPEGVLLCQAQLVQVQQQVTGDYNVFSRWKDLMNDAVKTSSEDNSNIFLFTGNLLSTLYYFFDGQIDQAYELVQKAITQVIQMQTPTLLYSAYQALALVLQADQHYLRAIDNVSLFLQSFLEYPPALLERGKLYNLADKYQNALADVSLAIALDGQEASYFSIRSDIYRNMQCYREALQDINQALDLEPRHADYFYQRGTIYSYIRQYTQAIADITQAIQFEPQNALYYTYRGGFYREMRRYQEALGDIQRALELQPTLANALIEQAVVYRDTERFSEALQVLDHAIELDPNNPFYYLHRGIVYRLQGHYQRAQEDFRQSRNTSGNLAYEVVWNRYKFLAYVQCSITYHYEEKYQLALQDIMQAIDLKSAVTCFGQRGTLYYNVEQYQLALEDFQQAVTLDAYVPRIFCQRASAYQRLGQCQEALRDADRAIELDPEDHLCYYTRASIYWVLKQYDKAHSNIEQALRLAQIDVRPLASRIGLIIYSLFAQHNADAREHFDLFMRECQSSYFVQYILFMLRDFMHLNIELPTAHTFSARLQKHLDKLLGRTILERYDKA